MAGKTCKWRRRMHASTTGPPTVTRNDAINNRHVRIDNQFFYAAPARHSTARPRTRIRGLMDVYRSLNLEKASTTTAETMEDDIDEDALCPVDCVEELSTIKDFREKVLLADEKALVILDIYKPSCGACKYIANGYSKLCKKEGLLETSFPTLFYKHNIIEDDDDDEERTDLGKFLQVRAVPTFLFYKNGNKIDQFATRDKKKIDATILKYTPKRRR